MTKPSGKGKPPSEEQRLMAIHLKELFPGMLVYFEERFCDDRKWRFDVSVPAVKIAVEIEGGIYIQGRHSRGAAMEADMEKYNRAALAGWKVLRFTPRSVRCGKAKEFIWRHVQEI